jgi:nicotinate-nucleotide adenylyltransferase
MPCVTEKGNTQTRMVFFGGSFDPVHHGHLVIARDIAEKLGLAQITLVPAARSPHKDGAVATADQRLEMLRLAVKGEKVFAISEIEIHAPGPSYTVDTIRRLRQVHGPDARIAWVVGADMLVDLPKWQEVNELLSMAELIVAVRPPWHLRLDAIFVGLEHSLGPQQVNRLRKSIVPTSTIEISSTEIRARVADGRSIRFLVPEAVDRYIRKTGLYGKKT